MSDPILSPSDEAPRDAVVQNVEQIIARLLRWGVLISLLFLVAGTLVSFFQSHRYGNTSDDLPGLIGKSGDFPHTIRWLAQGLRSFHGQPLIVLGLLILIATPLLRVAVSIVAYIIERDAAFVLITSLVMLLLIVSLFLGSHG